MKLNLGALEIPYETAAGKTTADVAEFVERKYGLLQAFADRHEQQIADALADGVAGSIENLIAGGHAGDPFAGAESKISGMMREFLSSREAEQAGLPGVPTGAALKGVNRRLKSRRGARRPSFIDTGLMQSSYVAWIEGAL